MSLDDEPISYLVLQRGTPVVTTDGVEIGTVLRVQDNVREHIFDGIVVQTAHGRVFVDAPEVDRITRGRVELGIDAEAAARLPKAADAEGAATPTTRRRWWQIGW
ncbi:MAG TPA: hypothetical protein VKD47_08375 [Miltoncostaeaceae bacterium]|nr:hypothetical protein [Miltoncostaeaceae bacterium]